jgi:hypothetical protein
LKPKRMGDIELEHDDRALRADWRAQHIGWMVFTLIIIAALLGAFGNGPLSSATLTDENAGLSIRYERIARWDSSLLMRVTLLPENTSAQTAVMWINNAYLEGMPVQWMNPPPLRSTSREDRTMYEFPTGPGESGTITFEFRAERTGKHTLRLGRDDSDGVAIRQFVLP